MDIPGNSSEGPNEEEDFFAEHLTSFEWYFYVFNGVVGSVLNVAVLFIGLMHTDTHDKPRQLIVINMTFADLFTCLVYMLTRPYLNRFPMFACYPYYVTIFTSQLASCLNLLWLNVDKLVYIKFPLHYYTLVSRPKVMALTVLSWASLLIIGLIIYTFMSVRNPCNAVEISPLIYMPICMFVSFSLILLKEPILFSWTTPQRLASFVISAIIYCIAHNSRRMEPQARRLFQRLFFVFSSTLWTFVTCLPYRLLYITYVLCPPCQSELFYKITDTFFSILVLGIVINPLITIVTQRLYRQCVVLYSQRLLHLFTSTLFSSLNHDDSSAVTLKLGKRRLSRTKSTTTDGSTRKHHFVIHKAMLIKNSSADSRSDLKEVTLRST